MADEPRSVTPEERAREREIHAGAQEAGVRIAGLTEVAEYEDVHAGSKDDPVLIGQKMSVRVRVAEDGTLLPRRENSDETTPSATSILTIDVIPSVEFDGDGEPHVVWTGHASQVDVATGRIISSSLSGPSREDDEALQAGRPHHEYADDPAYKDAMLAKMATSPAEAVTQALGSIASSGRMNVGRLEPAPVAATPTPTGATGATRAGVLGLGCLPWLIGAAVLVVIAAVVGLVVVLGAGSDDTVAETPQQDPAEVAVDPPGDDPQTETEPPADEAETEEEEGESEEEENDEEEPDPEPEPDDTGGALPGTYEITGRVDSPCGGSYDVFLRMILFLGGQVTIDQLVSAGGNPFQTASGQWRSFTAVASGFPPGLFEVWLVFVLADQLAVYNIYGPSASAVTPDTPPDPAAFDAVDSAEALATAVGADPESCASPLLDVTSTFTPFPEEAAAG